MLREKERQLGKQGKQARSWAFVRFIDTASATRAIAAGEGQGVGVALEGGGGAVLTVRHVDTEMLTAKQQGSAMIGSSAEVWRAARS